MNLSVATSAPSNLDAIFGALADPTRRAIIGRLSKGEASVNDIAKPFSISQPAISRHLKVLEQAGLVERDTDQQRRPARLKGDALAHAAEWIATFSAFWGDSFNQLDDLLASLQEASPEGE